MVRSADRTTGSVKPSGDLGFGGARGISLAAPAAASGVPARFAPAVAGQADVTSTGPSGPPTPETAGPSASLTVDFATGSAELTPQAHEVLDDFGEAMSSSDLANRRFRIEGHTDTVGTPAYNEALSKRRAEAVAHYLTERFGVRSARLEAVGMGEAGLREPTPPQTPDARNRRVLVVDLGA